MTPLTLRLLLPHYTTYTTLAIATLYHSQHASLPSHLLHICCGPHLATTTRLPSSCTRPTVSLLHYLTTLSSLLTTLSYYTLLTTLISIRRMTPDGCEILALTQAGVGVSIAHGEILAQTRYFPYMAGDTTTCLRIYPPWQPMVRSVGGPTATWHGEPTAMVGDVP